MAVTALKPYPARPVDGLEHYHGDQLVYFSWDHHLMFAAPFITCVSPSMRLLDYLETVIRPLITADPDAGHIDWARAVWILRGHPFAPDLARSLAYNGVRHKDLLRLGTPGLNSLCGAGPG